ERTLWETVTKEIKPLRKRAKPKTAPEIESAVAEAVLVTTQTAIPTPVAVPRVTKPASPPPRAPIGRRARAQLSRGRKDIDARIDLHGMTQARAHRALLAFLSRASDDGLTFVLVITGKGRSGAADSERGVLRRQVPEWLSLPEFRSM